jgi:ABC-type glycerol-3-phosphate transport system substrate-binding protein
MVGANDWSTFLVDWYTRYNTMGGALTSGNKNDGTLEVHFDSPEGVAAIQNMIDLLPSSPEAVTTYGFTEQFNAFLAGKVAMMPFWSTIGGALVAPDSPVKDTVAFAPVPADDGNPRGIRGGWGLGIPKNLPQERKDCAWLILTQITSKAFEKHQVLTHQTDPNRTSTGSDPEITAALPYIPEAVRAIETAQILEVADLPEAFEIITAAAEQINLGLLGTKDAATAMADLQAAVTAILQREGYQAS